MIYNFTCEKHDRVKIKAVEHVFDYVCDDFKDRYYIESEEQRMKDKKNIFDVIQKLEKSSDYLDEQRNKDSYTKE